MLMMLNKTGNRVQSKAFPNGHHIVPRNKDNEHVITVKNIIANKFYEGINSMA